MNEYKDTTHARQSEHSEPTRTKVAKWVDNILSFVFLVGVLLVITHCQPITP